MSILFRKIKISDVTMTNNLPKIYEKFEKKAHVKESPIPSI